MQTPTLQPGQFLVRNEWLSLDPYMRGRMNEGKSYAAAQPLGDVMVGGTAGTVVESRHPQFKAGDKVVASLGWQEYGVSDGTGVYKVDTRVVPLSAYLGAVGMPGVTAWYGLKKIIEPKEGETVLVSAATGAVGGVVGQLAKLAGCRAVGIAGGPEKCTLRDHRTRFRRLHRLQVAGREPGAQGRRAAGRRWLLRERRRRDHERGAAAHERVRADCAVRPDRRL